MMKPRRFARFLFAAGAIFAACCSQGCGVKSAPISPEKARPEQILDLQALREHKGIRLTWGRPERYAGGERMNDLAGFTVLRSDDQQPYQPIVEVPITDQERFQVQEKFSYLDALVLNGHDYRYEVISRTTDGYVSLPSNVAEVHYLRRRRKRRAQPKSLPMPSAPPSSAP